MTNDKNTDKSVWDIVRDHSVSTYVKFSEELTFLTPTYEHVDARVRGYLMLVFLESFALN